MFLFLSKLSKFENGVVSDLDKSATIKILGEGKRLLFLINSFSV